MEVGAVELAFGAGSCGLGGSDEDCSSLMIASDAGPVDCEAEVEVSPPS